MFSFLKKLKEFQKHKKQKKRLRWFFVVGLLLAFCAGYLLYSTPLLTPKPQEVLPESGMIAFAQMDISLCTKAKNTFPELCRAYANTFSSLFGISVERAQSFADTAVFAMYSSLSSVEKEKVTMFRITDLSQANAFMLEQYGEHLRKENTKYRDVFSLGEGSGYALFWRGWLLFSPTDISDTLLAVKQGKSLPASTLSAFSEEEMGDASIFGFSKTKHIASSLPASFLPLTDFFPEIRFALRKTSHALSLHLSTPARALLPENSTTPLPKAMLSAMPSKNLIALGGVGNAADEIEQILSYFEQTDPAFAISLRSRLQEWATNMFGNTLALEQDIFPLLEGKTVFGVYDVSGAPKTLVAVQVDDEEFLRIKREKMIAAAKEVVAQFVPRILTHTLPDNTTIQEVVACDDCVTFVEEENKGTTLTVFSATSEEGKTQELALGIKNDIFAFSSTKALVYSFFENLHTRKLPIDILSDTLSSYHREVLLIFPQKMHKDDIFHPSWLVDFSSIVLAYGQNENRWNIDITGTPMEK